MRLLYIGNSHLYFNSLPDLLARIAEENGETVEHGTVFGGGYTFQDHWRSGEALHAIGEGPWDQVILQASGTEPLAYEARETLAYGGRLAQAALAAGAAITWYMSHAYDAASPTAQAKARGIGREAAERLPRMAGEAASLYGALARENGGRVAPVAIAWENLFQESPGTRLHASDGYHPNPLGSLLGALVLHEAVFGAQPAALPERFEVEREMGWGSRIRIEPTASEWKLLQRAAAAAAGWKAD